MRMSDLRRRLLLRNEPSAKGRIDVGRRQRVHLPATAKGIGERLLASFPRPPKKLICLLLHSGDFYVVIRSILRIFGIMSSVERSVYAYCSRTRRL